MGGISPYRLRQWLQTNKRSLQDLVYHPTSHHGVQPVNPALYCLSLHSKQPHPETQAELGAYKCRLSDSVPLLASQLPRMSLEDPEGVRSLRENLGKWVGAERGPCRCVGFQEANTTLDDQLSRDLGLLCPFPVASS